MSAHDCEAPLRAETGSDQRDLLIAQCPPQVVDIVGVFQNGIAPQIDPLCGKLRHSRARPFDGRGSRAGQTGRLIQRKFRRPVAKLQNLTAFAIAALVYKDDVADIAKEVYVFQETRESR